MSNRRNRQHSQSSKGKSFSVKPAVVIAVILTFLPVIGLALILVPNTPRNSPLSGLEVFHDCQEDLSVLVGLLPFHENSQDVLVTLSIDGWDKNYCHNLQINFPGTTYNHKYLIDAGFAMEAGVDPQTALSNEYSRRNINNLDVRHDWIGQDIISFATNELKDFSGSVEFTWVQGMEKTGFGEFSLLLPFGAVNNGETTLKSIKNYEISLLSPSGYKLTSHSPDRTGYKPFGNVAFYNFSIEGSRTPLSLTFQNPILENKKEILLVVLATLFGIGLTLDIELVIEFLKKSNAG